jgi:hypothetical protein
MTALWLTLDGILLGNKLDFQEGMETVKATELLIDFQLKTKCIKDRNFKQGYGSCVNH